MRILHGLKGLLELPAGTVLSIGNFDGVHLGHRHILGSARELADGEGAAVGVVTFEPHPMTVLRPEQAPRRLTPPVVKEPLIESAGADFLVVLPPEPQILGLTAEKFWEILRDQVRPAHLVEGASFRFGKGAAGTIERLGEWAKASDVVLHVAESARVALLDLQVAPVSSSLIRFLLGFGRVRDAAICLGRPYLLRGVIGRGFARGKELGVPTANLDCGEQLTPGEGVYAGRSRVDGRTYPAAVSIGTMPTFGENACQIEAHLVGFEGDLYGRILEVELLDWLREQRRYGGVEELKGQISRDIADTVAWGDREASRPIAAEYVAEGQTPSGFQSEAHRLES